MRFPVPSERVRRRIIRRLGEFFQDPDNSKLAFRQALLELTQYYDLPKVSVDLVAQVDRGRSVGRTFDNGKIVLQHPNAWKRGHKYNGEKQWINGVLHEMGHYVLWAHAEAKADEFAAKIEGGIW